MIRVGLLNRRHIYAGEQKFATAIPRQNHVQVYVHKYQNILHHDPGDLTYEQYFDWLDRNGYTEERTERHTRTIREEYDQIHQKEIKRPQNARRDVERQSTLFDYL